MPYSCDLPTENKVAYSLGQYVLAHSDRRLYRNGLHNQLNFVTKSRCGRIKFTVLELIISRVNSQPSLRFMF